MCLTAACKNPSNLSAGTRKRTPTKGQAKELTLAAFFPLSLSHSLSLFWLVVGVRVNDFLHTASQLDAVGCPRSLSFCSFRATATSLWIPFCGWFMLICALHTVLDYIYTGRYKIIWPGSCSQRFLAKLVCLPVCLVIPLPGHVC